MIRRTKTGEIIAPFTGGCFKATRHEDGGWTVEATISVPSDRPSMDQAIDELKAEMAK